MMSLERRNIDVEKNFHDCVLDVAIGSDCGDGIVDASPIHPVVGEVTPAKKTLGDILCQIDKALEERWCGPGPISTEYIRGLNAAKTIVLKAIYENVNLIPQFEKSGVMFGG